jgi:hypothetical protein
LDLYFFKTGKEPLERSFVRNKEFFGVEIEFECENDSMKKEIRKNIISLSAYHDFIFFKNDGSLRNGMEMVSNPASLSFHKEFNWKEIFEYLTIDAGCSAENTCGLHIHLGTESLGGAEPGKQLNILKLVWLMQKFWKQMIVFSRRKPTLLSYCKRAIARYDLKLIKNRCIDRYICINIANRGTVEFRIFKGTMNHFDFIASLQLIHCMRKFVMSNNVYKIAEAKWETFKDFCFKQQFVELNSYFTGRGL